MSTGVIRQHRAHNRTLAVTTPKYVYRQCGNASSPVAAVRNAGRLTVSSGSRIALLGINQGLKMIIFRPSLCDVMTEDRPTSLPVPAR